ncbi:MAG: succinate dehydrogenase/fumarate reductase iron-sulfur subunit, partial [Gammaproteobacteria bacterium]|nr:succinate dehydrogenase/fumarate reductase iron-sulfur subunit [Gammaproteobacteria bacterium]
MKLVLRIWRQASAEVEGWFEDYPVSGISPDYSFLEVLDRINEDLVSQNQEPVAFEMDCREGICGS